MIEIEIKLAWLAPVKDAVLRVEGLGFVASSQRTLEIDQVYDRHDSLRQANQLLRVRREQPQGADVSTEATITYKGPPEVSRYKKREEVEFVVSDGNNFELVLERLGYSRSFRYEKYRTKYRRSSSGLVTLDETPIGVFLELEGEPGWIDETAQQLGFSAQDYLTASYASLFREYQKQNPGTKPDMTFDLSPGSIR